MNPFSSRAKELRGSPPVGFIDFGVECRIKGHKVQRAMVRVHADYLRQLVADIETARKGFENLGAVCVVVCEGHIQVEAWRRDQIRTNP
jgi:hypothetical protein